MNKHFTMLVKRNSWKSLFTTRYWSWCVYCGERRGPYINKESARQASYTMSEELCSDYL